MRPRPNRTPARRRQSSICRTSRSSRFRTRRSLRFRMMGGPRRVARGPGRPVGCAASRAGRNGRRPLRAAATEYDGQRSQRNESRKPGTPAHDSGIFLEMTSKVHWLSYPSPDLTRRTHAIGDAARGGSSRPGLDWTQPSPPCSLRRLRSDPTYPRGTFRETTSLPSAKPRRE